MKKFALLLFVFSLLTSCQVEGELTHDPVDIVVDNNVDVLRYSGDFSPTSGIVVEGSVNIYTNVANGNFLKLENFNISDGPDLKVYLSKTDTPSDFVNLGALTSATTYAIPAQVNIADYPFVLIHCQQYNHLFAIAALTQN